MDVSRPIVFAFKVERPRTHFASGQWALFERSGSVTDMLTRIDAYGFGHRLDVATEIRAAEKAGVVPMDHGNDGQLTMLGRLAAKNRIHRVADDPAHCSPFGFD